MANYTNTIINELSEKVKEVHSILIGDEVLYTNEDMSVLSLDINDFDDDVVEATPDVCLNMSPQVILSLEKDGTVKEAKVWYSMSPDVVIDLVDNTISAYYYDHMLVVPVENNDIVFDVLPAMIEMHALGKL